MYFTEKRARDANPLSGNDKRGELYRRERLGRGNYREWEFRRRSTTERCSGVYRFLPYPRFSAGRAEFDRSL